MSFMIAFGLSSIMLCLGVLLRAKIPFLRNMLVPSSVIAGILGFALVNLAIAFGIDLGTNTDMFTEIVNQLFTISFISISLTSSPKGSGTKGIVKGALGLGTIWSLLYALTPLVGAGVLFLVGRFFGMQYNYGLLIQFAFCQGPGQAAAYGKILEGCGDVWQNATMVAITFAAIGFLVAFLVGIPAAKHGIKCGAAKHCGQLNPTILKGYLKKEEQTDHMVKDTTCNSNIETLAFHFALIGLCYILALGIGKLMSFVPALGASLSAMTFMNGMYAAYIVKFFMKLLKIDFLLENTLQSKITGWTSDYLVVCAFMAISVSLISNWLIPIAIVSAAVTVVTYIFCFYFGRRLGGSNDFERFLGLYGTCTGTVPSGISLVRIVDPNFHTTTAVELGACNLFMLFCTPVYLLILMFGQGLLKAPILFGGLVICVGLYLVILKLTKCWNKPTFSWKVEK